MKKIVVLLTALFFTASYAQDQQIPKQIKFTAHNKGKFYFYWGGNRDSYTKSDIHFKGDHYDFTVYNAIADDKPKGWHLDYVNPSRMTIPQTNFRMGYFINDHYNISVGLDHMKYVMRQYQVANVTGNINIPNNDSGSIYNDTYNNTPVDFNENDTNKPFPLLTFEHTDGLNYVNTEISRFDDVSKIFKIGNTDNFQINLTEGIGGGILYPKTNAQILGYKRHDDFHVSGYGVSAKVGLNFTIYKFFFIQTELKGGYINMPDIRTTAVTNDTASQHFMFFERIIAFGGIFTI
jgi:hypothetical protein